MKKITKIALLFIQLQQEKLIKLLVKVKEIIESSNSEIIFRQI